MEHLADIFARTLVPDKATREAAEHALAELAEQQPDFLLQLIHFACQLTRGGAEGQRERSVCLAAAIYAHNVLRRSDWNRRARFTEPLKQAVRDAIVPLQCAAHVCDRVRRQVLAATAELVAYDFPARWPGLMPQLSSLVGQCVATLQGQLATVSPQSGRGSNNTSDGFLLCGTTDETTGELCRLKGALSVLRLCCKVYENPQQTDAAATDAFAAQLVPSLVDLCDFLVQHLWLPSLNALSGEAMAKVASPTVYGDEGIFAVPAVLAEASHCVRLTLKCLWSLLSRRLPRYLCAQEAFSRCWLVCVDAVGVALRQRVLPWSAARLTQFASAAATMPPQTRCVCQTGHDTMIDELSQATGVGDCEHFACFQASAVWRVAKWGEMIACKLTQEFAQPRQCERRARAVATLFCEHYLCAAAQGALELVRWHARALPPLRLNSKAHIMALELLTAAVDSRRAYATVLQPAAEELMTGLLFPRLSFSGEDDELWASNPEEYVRRQMSPTGDLYSARVLCSGLLLTFAVPSHKYQDASLLLSFVQFVVDQLRAHVPAVAVARDVVVSRDAARCVDAALYALYEFRKVLLQQPQLKDDVHAHFEPLLLQCVVPVLSSPVGFLRARAVLVLSVYSGSLHWSDAAAFQRMLRAVLPLFSDAATPVRVQTCMAFASLVRHPFARDVITPCIAELVGHYFQVMRTMDSEAVVRTLRKIIHFYNDTLARWGLELTELLVDHFATLLDTATGKYNAMENYEPSIASDRPGEATAAAEEDFANTLSAADELLETLMTLVKALPTAPAVAGGADDVFVQIQHRVGPMLYVILSQPSGPAYSFMDAALRLLDLLLERSSGVAGAMWRLVPCLHQLARGGAADYLPLMLTPVSNYLSSDAHTFLLTPLSALCPMPPFAASLAALTPAQVVCEMCLGLPGNVTLRPRELAAVPRLLETMMQYCWCVRREDAQPIVTTMYAPIEALVAVLAPQAMQAAVAPRRCRSLSLLFANTMLSCVLADTATALRAMSGEGDMASFVQCCYLPLVQPSEGGAAALRLRSHDRLLFVLTCSVALRWLTLQCDDAPELQDVAGRTLCGVVECALLGRFAADETAVCDEEAVVHERWLRRREANASPGQKTKTTTLAAGVDEDDGDEDAWSDEEDEETASDADLASFYSDSVVGEEDDSTSLSGRDEGGGVTSRAVAPEDGQLQTMLRQAQAMQHEADLDDEEDDDDDDMLEEDDFGSPVDAVNAWQELLQAVEELAPSGGLARKQADGLMHDHLCCHARQLATLLRADDARWRTQHDSIVRAAASLERVFALRRERAGHA